MKLTSLLSASCLLAVLAPVAKAQNLFTFDNIKPGTFLKNGESGVSNDGTLTATAHVTNSVDPGFSANYAYEFESNGPGNNNYGTNLHDIVLTNADSLPNTVLTVTFSHPIDELKLQFAIINGTADNIPVNTLTLSGGDTPDTSGGTFNSASNNFQGTLETYDASGFTTATLTFQGSAADDFGYAIDDVSDVPEPGVLTLALAGILPAVGLLRRRRAR